MNFLKLDIQLFAHHKGQGSTSNGRDSAGRRLGAKAADGQYITAGSIIYLTSYNVSTQLIIFPFES